MNEKFFDPITRLANEVIRSSISNFLTYVRTIYEKFTQALVKIKGNTVETLTLPAIENSER